MQGAILDKLRGSLMYKVGLMLTRTLYRDKPVFKCMVINFGVTGRWKESGGKRVGKVE